MFKTQPATRVEMKPVSKGKQIKYTIETPEGTFTRTSGREYRAIVVFGSSYCSFSSSVEGARKLAQSNARNLSARIYYWSA